MKPKYKSVCPYCGEICEGYVFNSLICKCGAKYYYTTQTWYERKKPKEKNTPDLVEVVRCKDCTEWDKEAQECSHWYGFRENDYCSYGERREQNEG